MAVNNYKEIFPELFDAMEMPVVIGGFGEDEIVSYPFIEYHREAPYYLSGDNKNYSKNEIWDISIYNLKDNAPTHWDICDKFEDLLDGANIAFDSTGDIFVEDIVYTTFSLSFIK